MAQSASSQTEARISASTPDPAEQNISPNLKFLLSNIKKVVTISLAADNYSLWRSQVLEIISANGFQSFLDISPGPPPPTVQSNGGENISNPLFSKWHLTDQNIATSICSTISAQVLPYVINLDTTTSIWISLQNRFQATNRSKVIQLKNELHNISFKNSNMTQYLTDIKSLVDQIAAAGATVDTEDIILYILNGLPPPYQSFKTSIRTMLTPISLDQLYPLLLSEEVNIASDAAKTAGRSDPTIALFNYRGRGRRARGRNNSNNSNGPRTSTSTSVICQICLKKGHSAQTCWHRLNPQYTPSSRTTNSALLAGADSVEPSWFLDSGASSHITNSLENMTISTPYQGSDTMTIGDGSSVNVSHTGAGILPTPSRKLNLSHILLSPSIQYNLLSISQLNRDNDISIVFDPNGFSLKDMKTQQVIHRGTCDDGLYRIPVGKQLPRSTALAANISSAVLWHQRLGHPNKRILNSISSCNSAVSSQNCDISCSFCNSSKCHKNVFDKIERSTQSLLSLIHSDVWGPAPVESNQGFRYYVIFVDDYSRFTWLFPLKTKSEVFDTFIHFKSQVENYTSRKIKILRTDGRTEFVNNSFSSFLKHHGIIHQLSCPYTPEQNGVVERKHRHIIETTRTLLATASVPYKYWADAVTTAVYLINRLPSPTIQNMSPFERIHNRKPQYTHLRVFGCECFPLIPPQARHKLQPKATSHVFLGYSDLHKGYKCLSIKTNKITISRHITFQEQRFSFSDLAHSVSTNNTELSPAVLLPTSVPSYSPHHVQPHPISQNTAPNIGTSTSSSIPVPVVAHQPAPSSPQSLVPSHHMVTRSKTGSLRPTTKFNLLHLYNQPNTSPDPTNYSEASKHFEWRQAMANEFLALQKQGTWTLVKPPPNASILGCKWTYKTKRHADGTIAMHKARLVAQGNHQQYGLDYMETFSPVEKLPTIRIFLTIALHHHWPVHQLDVANAFLHGHITETVYMTQPRGFEDSTHPDYVCHLNKALYGLKQAPRQWYNTFTSTLLHLGFSHSQSDPSLFVYNHNKCRIYLLVYVDDILISGNDPTAVTTILAKLSQQFNMKHLGPASEFIGIKITKSDNCYFLSQEKYVHQILAQAHLSDCKELANPSCTKIPDSFNPEPFLHNSNLYRSLTGSLQYLTITRPDISYSVNQLSQHMHDPQPKHIYLLKRLLRYLKGTSKFGIPISATDLTLQSFSDADWAGDPDSRKSTSGYCSFLGNTLISWTVKKQHTVARSSTESEYRALAALTADVLWIRRLLSEFGTPQTDPTKIYCDNTSSIALANNPVFHARTKHI
ncbi:Retrovirus-related Pol polyprotein from transposon TNT 1-94 [Dendrobium catenatum]|uniref:Retrovirus-related Pol polyprotein from transposon TNT 1-94 n=1 Tax=Dendrobium catenatum TaxID=906689 RepID=A0A2I0W3C6_9ASPA|nr:Retrovirus-related Pol polyprotein from transposon TNT 1-94 [Dendrobium catenatum]